MSSNIIKKCNGFTHDQNKLVLEFLKETNIYICECADGVRVNLDILSKKQMASLTKRVEEINEPLDPLYMIQ